MKAMAGMIKNFKDMHLDFCFYHNNSFAIFCKQDTDVPIQIRNIFAEMNQMANPADRIEIPSMNNRTPF